MPFVLVEACWKTPGKLAICSSPAPASLSRRPILAHSAYSRSLDIAHPMNSQYLKDSQGCVDRSQFNQRLLDEAFRLVSVVSSSVPRTHRRRWTTVSQSPVNTSSSLYFPLLFSALRRINQAAADQRDNVTIVHRMIRITEPRSEYRRWSHKL